MNVKAVIFDRDGVLTDFDLDAAGRILGPLVPLPLDEIAFRWETYGRAVGFPASVAEERTFFAGFWSSLADDLALPAPARAELLAFDYTTCMKPYADARPALEVAHQAGLAVGVLSNFSLATIDASLAAAGLRDLVDVALSSTLIGASKPEAAAYFAVTRALKVHPGECLFFDDERPCVEGARSVGMRAFQVARERRDHAVIDGVVADLSILRQLLT